MVANDASATGRCIIKIHQIIALNHFHLLTGPEYWFGDGPGHCGPRGAGSAWKGKGIKAVEGPA